MTQPEHKKGAGNVITVDSFYLWPFTFNLYL